MPPSIQEILFLADQDQLVAFRPFGDHFVCERAFAFGHVHGAVSARS